MSDTLKDFIEAHREGFDDLAPGDLWAKIEQGISTSINQPQGSKLKKLSFKNIKAMLKYGFGASALIVGTFLIVTSQPKKTAAIALNTSLPEKTQLPSSPAPELQTSVPVTTVRSEELPTPGSATTDVMALTAPVPEAMQPDTIHAAQVTREKPPYFLASLPPENTEKDSSSTQLDTAFTGIKRVEVQVHFCDVSINARSGDKVILHGDVSESSGSYDVKGRKAVKRSEYKIKYAVKDSVLKVWMESEKVYQKVSLKMINSKASEIRLDVPAHTDIQVQDGSGDVTANGLENRRTELQTSFGNIKAANIHSNFSAKVSSGDITLNNITGELHSDNSFGNQVLEEINGKVFVHSSSGSTTVKSLKGDAEVRSSFGQQKYENINGNVFSTISSGNLTVNYLTGNIDAKSSFGTLNFTNISGDVTAKASSGNIKVDQLKGTLILGTSFGDISGKNVTLVKGGDFKTASGSIHMNLLNEMKELSFDLKASSGNLQIEKSDVKTSSSQKLLIGEGPVLVRGVSSFGDQSYK